MYGKAFRDLRNGFALYHVWFYQAYHLLAAKYKRTVLGSLWIAGSMVSTSVALAVVYGALQGVKLADALPYVMAGILSFGMVSFMFGEAPELFLANGGMISNHAYPFTYYVFEGVAKNLLTFLHNVIVFEITTCIVGAPAIPNPLVLLGLVMNSIAMFSWGTVIGMVSSRYRDVRFLLPYLSQLVFFVTPVFYHPEAFTGQRRLLADANPFYALVQIVRGPLLGQYPPANLWILASGFTILGVVLWLAFFPPFRKQIPFWIH